MQIYNNNKNVQKHLSEHTHVSSMRYEAELRMILPYILKAELLAVPIFQPQKFGGKSA